MACRPDVLRRVPLFALLDDDETAVLAGQVEVKTFAPRQRIWKIGDAGGRAYVLVSGRVRVATVDEDHQEVVVDEPGPASFSALLPCSSKLPTRPALRRSMRASASKSTGRILPCCCSASRTQEWTCWLCWAGSFTAPSNWCASAPAETQTR